MNSDNRNLAPKEGSFTIIFDSLSGQIPMISFTCAVHKDKSFMETDTTHKITKIANNWM